MEAWGVFEGIDAPMLMAYNDAWVTAGGLTTTDLQVGLCGALLPDACLDPCE